MSGWFAYNTLVVLGGVSLLGAACGLVGAFAVLRKRALVGDALAHAALPGLCLAFIVTGERRLPVLLIGAFLSGLLGNAAISALGRFTRIKEDAAVGTILSVFVGAGFVLMRLIQNHYAGGAKAGLDSFILGKTAGMTRDDLQLIAVVAGLVTLFVFLLYKEFKLTSFDAGFARALGWPVVTLDSLLMALIAVAVVIGLPAVGVVMIAALLIIPGASARFWTNSLGALLLLAGGIGFAIGLIGTLISATYSVMPAGPIIVLTGTVFFVFSLLAGSERGLIAQRFEQRRFERQWRLRRLLRTLYEWGLRPEAFAAGELGDAAQSDLFAAQGTAEDAVRGGYLARVAGQQFALTDFGRRRAVEVMRGQRLWEACLTAHPELASGVADLAEETIDRVVPRETVERLTAELKAAGRWPD